MKKRKKKCFFLRQYATRKRTIPKSSKLVMRTQNKMHKKSTLHNKLWKRFATRFAYEFNCNMDRIRTTIDMLNSFFVLSPTKSTTKFSIFETIAAHCMTISIRYKRLNMKQTMAKYCRLAVLITNLAICNEIKNNFQIYKNLLKNYSRIFRTKTVSGRHHYDKMRIYFFWRCNHDI